VADVSDAARENRERTKLVGELALRLANEVIEACAVQGVVPMPLKGVLMLARWPELLGVRDLVDVDLLVRPDDMRTLVDVLRAQGFEMTVSTSAGIVLASDASPFSIDVHHRLFPHGLFDVPTSEMFARAEDDATLFAAPVARMSDEDLLAHLVGHFVKGRGVFGDDKSLDDIRWLLEQGVFPLAAAEPLAAHLRKLGLHRAAGYTLGHASFRRYPVVPALLRSLQLTAVERFVVAAARLDTDLHDSEPRWWTPHLLDRSLPAGSRSLALHAEEGALRFARGFAERIRA
jgi:hypothetical protein